MSNDSSDVTLFHRPAVGTALAIASGLSFFVLCMILPLVGRAGSRVAHADKNQAAFLTVLLITWALAGATLWSKMGLRAVRGGVLPYYSLGLTVGCLIMLVILLLGGFSI